MSYQGAGRTDKAGNKYEINYVISQLLRVIGEEIYSVTIESIGEDEKGVDLWIVNNDGTREGQQCKGRNTSKDKWTIGDIKKYNIFNNWKFHLDRNGNNYVSIVSPISFVLLEDLTNLAHTSSKNPKDFYENQVLKANKKMRDFYSSYCQEMKLDVENEADLIKSLDYLNRTSYHQFPDQNLKNIVLKDIKYLFSDNKEKVYNALLNYIINENVWGKAIDFITIKRYLDEKKIKLSNLAYDETILPRIQVLNEEFNSFFRPINDEMILRDEYKKCEEIIDKGESAIISGKAGYGKSGIVQLIAENCKDNEIPYIAIKLDKRIPENNTEEWGKKLGLPSSISYCLDNISKEKKAVIILDQLDALRWSQANSIDSVFVCKQLIEEIERINLKRENKISIILVCRSYDLKYDNNIKSILNDKQNKWNEIEVEKFSGEVVKNIVGEQYKKNSKKLNELLQIPSNLYIWCHLDKSKAYDSCFTTNKLIETWWNQLLDKSSDVNIDSVLIKNCKNEIVKKMFNMSRINIMRKFLDVDENALKYLSSNGFLFIENQNVSFTHQRIYDYFIEIKMINMYQEGKSIEKIIGDIERQTPPKRYQIQMFLEDLHEINAKDFIRIGKELLLSDNVRFYIKYVFFEVIGQIEKVDSELEDFILEFLNNEVYGKHIINNVIQYNVQYVKILLNNGILDKWMEDNSKIELCVSILRSIQNKFDREIAKFIEDHLFKNEEIDKRIYRCFGLNVSTEIDEMFELRMKIYEKYPELSEDYIDFKSLFKTNEMRAIKLIKFWIEYNISNKNKRLYRYEEELVNEESDIIIKNDEEIINVLLPCIPIEIDEHFGKWSGRCKYSIGIERTAVNIIKKANSNLIKKYPDKFWNIYEKYMGKGYSLFNEFILNGFEKLPEQYSDKIIEYFCDNFEENIFEQTSGNNDKLLATKKVLMKHSQTCSIENYRKLENIIYYYTQKNSLELYKDIRKYKLNYTCRKMSWDWWGNLQVELLPYLCNDRMSKKTKELLMVLNRKFNNGSKYFHYSNGHSGTVLSPVSGKKLSDKQWLKILSSLKIKNKECSNWKEVDEGFIESNLSQFSSSFSNVVSNEPNRMIDLVLNNKKIIIDDYIDSIYSGLHMSEKLNEVPNEKIEQLLKEFPFDNESYRANAFCWIVEKKKDTNWSEYTLNIIKNIAMNNIDSDLGKFNVINEKDTEIKSIEMLRNNYLNCTKGAAARTISHLLYNKNELLDQFKEIIIKMANDENPAVKFASLSCLYTTYYIDKDWATPIIINLFEQDQRFLSFWGSRKLMFNMYKDNKNKVLEIIKNLYYSEDKELKEIGALAVAEMYIVNNEFVDIVNDVKNMDKIQQEQIVRIMKIYFNTLEYNEKCKALIIKLNDNNCDLETFISKIFYEKEIKLKRDKEFLIKIIKSNSGRRSLYALVNYLEENALSVLDFSDIILEVSKSFVNCEENQENIYFYGDEISKLVVGLYDETEGKEEKEMKNIANECLDIWDKMFERQIGTIRLLSKEISDK